MINALSFLLDTFSTLYLLILLLRFWLPIVRANFRNQVAQGVLRYTSPLVVPVRRYVPAFGRLDTATIVIAYTVKYLTVLALLTLSTIGRGAAFPTTDGTFWLMLAWLSVVELASLSVMLFIVAIVLRVILNLIGRYMGPLTDMLVDLTEPILRPIRNVIPPLGVLDLSAYVAIILLIALNMILADMMPGVQ